MASVSSRQTAVPCRSGPCGRLRHAMAQLELLRNSEERAAFPAAWQRCPLLGHRAGSCNPAGLPLASRSVSQISLRCFHELFEDRVSLLSDRRCAHGRYSPRDLILPFDRHPTAPLDLLQGQRGPDGDS